MENFLDVRPLMQGDCIACTNRDICKYKNIADSVKTTWGENIGDYNVFTLICSRFESKILKGYK